MFSDAITVYPRNLAAARFYFKAPFGAATIRGRLDFEGGVYRDRYVRTYTASIIILRSCMHACAYGNCCRPLTMRRDFEGGVYHGTSWQINAATFRGAARFRGNTVYYGKILREVKGLCVWQDQISIMPAQSIICYIPGEILREVKVHT